jgi:hypothetical protein
MKQAVLIIDKPIHSYYIVASVQQMLTKDCTNVASSAGDKDAQTFVGAKK